MGPGTNVCWRRRLPLPAAFAIKIGSKGLRLVMTKTFWIGVYIASAALWAQPGTTAIAGIPTEKGVYYRGASGWETLPLNPLMGFQEGYVKQLLGLARPDGVADLPGSHAAVRIPNARPTFYLRGLPAGSRLYLV